jgi:hypothetical protein
MTRRALALGLTSLLAACDPGGGAAIAPLTAPPLVTDRQTRGTVTNVSPGATADGGASLHLDDPTRSAHVGRAPRRLDIDQFKSSLEQLVGARWTGPRSVRTAAAPSGVRFEQEADLMEFFAATLGRPDYITTTSEVLEPTVTFSKLAADAARSVCARGVVADAARPRAERRLLVEVERTDTVPTSEAAVRRNIAALALRLWGLDLAVDSATVDGVLNVFRVAVTQPGATPLDGWRAVCIDLATDARFLSY